MANLILEKNAAHNEREVLRIFFDIISDMEPRDREVSDSKPVKNTLKEMRAVLRNLEYKCTCARVTWGGICEVCQASDKELVYLRNFYRQICNAKKNNLTGAEIQEIVENTKEHVVNQ